MPDSPVGSVKGSRYNIVLDGSSSAKLLYNTLSGACMRLPEEIQNEASFWISGEARPLGGRGQSSRIGRHLLSGSFVVAASLDEIEVVRRRFDADETDGTLRLTILPTLACNLSCTYCYQKSRSPGMSRETQADVVAWAERLMKSRAYRAVAVDWYGGEPLLARRRLEALSTQLIRLADEAGMEYRASLVTNGTLVGKDIGEFIDRNRIKDAQVTLDGLPGHHDARRPFSNGKPSSKQVLSGVKALAERVTVRLRINTDRQNLLPAEQLARWLDEEGLFCRPQPVIPYLASVSPLSSACGNVCSTALASLDFFKASLDFQLAVCQRARNVSIWDVLDVPKRVSKACGAQSRHLFSLDPYGNLYKCGLETHDPKLSAGSVGSDYLSHVNYRRWVENHPFDRSDCLNCKFLPLCMGGCPKFNFKPGFFHAGESCVYWQEHFPALLRKIAELPRQTVANLGTSPLNPDHPTIQLNY